MPSRGAEKASRERHADITIAVNPPNVMAERQEDWGNAPDVSAFLGRTHELATLRRWVVDDHCRLVAILGIVVWLSRRK